MEFPLETEYEPKDYSELDTYYGPSSEVNCRVTVGNVCGSGSHVGYRNGKSLVLTNAHVAGTTIGKDVTCTFPALNGGRVATKIIMSAYSNRVMADWAILEADRDIGLPTVKLSKDKPEGSLYTAGYPRCRGPYSQKLTIDRIFNGGTTMTWDPNSIGGQSGSAVHSFLTHLQVALLTWSMNRRGAGQTTYGIWHQYINREAGLIGFEKPPELIELGNCADDLENGIHFQTNITELDIWAHKDTPPTPEEPPPGEGCESIKGFVVGELKDLIEKINLLEGGNTTEPTDPTNPPLFDL